MKEIKSILTQLLFICTTLLLSCSDDGGSSEEPSVERTPTPSKAIGVLPENGEPCSDYETVVGDDSQVSVLFRWNAAQNAQNYELQILDGQSEVSKTTINALEANVVLERGKTYSWTVTAINSAGQSPGDSYSFTTPGIQIGNYAPYTAEITVEFDSGTFEMQISWVANDEDGDTLKYDVKVSESETILIQYSGLEAVAIDPIVFTPATSYQIEVTTRDSNENFSVSTLNIESPD